MKYRVILLAATLALGAGTARADYTISLTTSPTVTTAAGESGQSTFDVSFSGGGNFSYVNKNLWAVDSFANPLTTGVDSPFSSLTIDPSSTLLASSGQSYASGHSYELIVDWTVSTTAAAGDYGVYFNLFANQPNGVRANAGATDVVNIQPSSVPEPSQSLACLLVLGGCGLSLGGRKWMKTSAA